jgi:hypothetical protein
VVAWRGLIEKKLADVTWKSPSLEIPEYFFRKCGFPENLEFQTGESILKNRFRISELGNRFSKGVSGIPEIFRKFP